MDTQTDGMKSKKGLSFLAAATAVFLWASAFTASKYALGVFSPEVLMLLRFLIASLTLAIIGFIKKIKLPRKRDIPLFAVSGFIGIFSYMLLFNTGLTTVDTGVTSFIIASAPVFTTILARILLKETVSLSCWAGIGISFCGLALTTISQVTDFTLNTGVLLLLMAALALSGYNLLQRRLSKAYTALEATTYSIIAATCFMLIFLPQAFHQLPTATPRVHLVLIYLGVFPGALAYLAWGYLLASTTKTAHVTMPLFLNPFVALVLGHFLLKETFSPLSLLGGVVIIAGMLLSTLGGKRNR